jgi:excisionase family DNA binding protein
MSAQQQALPLMTAEEVAQALRLGLSTVYGLARSGELPSIKFGEAVRFDPLDVETFKASCRRTTTKPASAGATNLTGLLTDADSALASYFQGTGRQPKRKPTRASKTGGSSHLSLAHTKASP